MSADWSAHLLDCRQALHRSEQALLDGKLIHAYVATDNARQALSAMLLWIAVEMEKPRDE
jgi:hypothetical protein